MKEGSGRVSSIAAPTSRQQGVEEGRPILVVAEEVDDLPDEGYDRFSTELAAALVRRRQVLVHFTPQIGSNRSLVAKVVARLGRAWRAARQPEVRPQQAGTDQAVMRNDDQAIDLFIAGIGQREDRP